MDYYFILYDSLLFSKLIYLNGDPIGICLTGLSSEADRFFSRLAAESYCKSLESLGYLHCFPISFKDWKKKGGK